MKFKLWFLIILLFSAVLNAIPPSPTSDTEMQAQAAMQHFLEEVERDPLLTHGEQRKKVQEFKVFADSLPPEVASFVTHFPNKNPHPRLIPYLEEALIKAHAFYLEGKANPNSNNIFRDFSCWNEDIAELFSKLKLAYSVE